MVHAGVWRICGIYLSICIDLKGRVGCDKSLDAGIWFTK
jgi:hypothetical protein